MAQGNSERVREAQKLAVSNPQKAEEIYKEILSKPPSVTSEAAIREHETALIGLGELYRDQQNTHELVELVTKSRTVLSSFAKAKTAKLGRSFTLQQHPFKYSTILILVLLFQQSANCSISSTPSPTRPTPKSQSPSLA